MSKFLYFYSFLYNGNSYLLRTAESIHSQLGSSTVAKHSKQEAPTAILFFDETMTIIDEFTLRNYTAVTATSNTAKETNEDSQFLSELTGTLIEKKLMINSNLGHGQGLQISTTLLDHFDVVLSNLEFKLVIKTGPDEVVNVYYDTRFLVYSFCVVPGMRISLSNLIRRNDGAFKANSMLCATFRQDFNLLKELVETDIINSTLELSSQTAKKTLFENLSDLDSLYEHFYSNPIRDLKPGAIELNDSEFRFNLLFKCSEKSDGQLLKIMAQITKIYDLELRIKCRVCALLASSCACTKKETLKKLNYNQIEF
jgi:hypothetical protein